jgi:ribosomal protein S18 acetylase RimI-like enzyme
MAEVPTIADLWVDLAESQQSYDSHLCADSNRQSIRESIAGHVVADGLLVARDDSVAGFVMFELETGRFEQDVTRGTIVNLYVRPDYRGEGVGSALLDAAEAALASAGADVVALDVMASNRDAIRFYERHGYLSHRIEMEKPVESDRHSKED